MAQQTCALTLGIGRHTKRRPQHHGQQRHPLPITAGTTNGFTYLLTYLQRDRRTDQHRFNDVGGGLTVNTQLCPVHTIVGQSDVLKVRRSVLFVQRYFMADSFIRLKQRRVNIEPHCKTTTSKTEDRRQTLQCE